MINEVLIKRSKYCTLLCTVHETLLLESYNLGLGLDNRLFLFGGCKGGNAAAFQVPLLHFLKNITWTEVLIF